MTPKITQKNYEAIKIYNQKEKIFELKGQIQTLQKQLTIAVQSLSTITHYAPTCFRTEECPLEGGCGFDNGCFRCGFATAFEALQQIKELEKWVTH